MEKGSNEFLRLLCKLYLVVLVVALPLYTGDGYWNLGDTKYLLFRNLSFLCQGCWLAAELAGRVLPAARHMAGVRKTLCAGKISSAMQDRRAFSAVDWAVVSYGGATVLSALLSVYGRLAWTGYGGWYMGAVSQLLLAGIYFFVSRRHDGGRLPLYLGEAACAVVTALGLLHRLGIDPLGLMAYWTNQDWEYSHMLSTIGNINWLCGYYSVALAFPMAHFLWTGARMEISYFAARAPRTSREDKTSLLDCMRASEGKVPAERTGRGRAYLFARGERALPGLPLYAVTVAAFVLLGVQGSQGGLLILAVCVAACLFLGRGYPTARGRVYGLLAGFLWGMALVGLGMELRGGSAAVVADGDVFSVAGWQVWAGLGLAAVLWSVHRKRGCLEADLGSVHRKRGWSDLRSAHRKRGCPVEDSSSGREERLSGWLAGHWCVAVLGLLAIGLAAGGSLLLWRGIDDSFGSGRGFLWRISLEAFRQAGWKDRLLGAGPDCYAEAVFGRLGTGSDVWKGEYWDGAVFTNAHNEILSQLCNVGILGTACYLAIFVAGFWRYGNGCREAAKGRTADRGIAGQERVSAGFAGAEDRLEVQRASGRTYGNFSEDGRRELWTGLLAIAMYGAHSLISFQQVLNAPLLFLVLGICEGRMRRDGARTGRENRMRWKRFRVKTVTEAEDIIISAFYDLGLEGAQIEDRVPLTALEKERMFVDILPEGPEDDGIAYLSFFVEEREDGSLELGGETVAEEAVLTMMREGLEELREFIDIGEGQVSVDETADVDWINNWKQDFHQFYIDDILVVPSWEEVREEDRGKVILHIDPGTAFGTGMHETTQLCVRQLRRYVAPGARLLDVGTGSGILSILSLMFGAGHAVGTDLDECAADAVAENCEANGIDPSRFEMWLGNLITEEALREQVGYGAYDIVVANILAEVLVPLTPVAMELLKSGGIYIASGIIDDKEETVTEAVKVAGFAVLEVNRQGEWVSITARKG